MKDLISRQAAIDRAVSIPMFGRDVKMVAVSEIKNLPSVQPEQIARDIATIIENEKDMRVILNAPSAQSEIIRCKDCMHNGSFDTDCPIDWNGKEYCSFAERRQDADSSGNMSGTQKELKCTETHECVYQRTGTHEPQRMRGKWIECDHEKWVVGVHALRCSECNGGYHLNNEMTIYYWNFCPNCGAKMEGTE